MTTHSLAQDAYHDTISRMARKYSQYQLPSASDLGASDDEGNDHKLEDDDEDEEDEDILSDTQTMLSHLSQSSKPYSLLRKSSSSPSRSKTQNLKVHFGSHSLSTSHLNVVLSPMTEIREIQMDKAYFIDIFDKYFDESKEGDVDIDEFRKGLHKLGVSDLSSSYISKLFALLLIAGDGDNNNRYLQSEQFSDFLTQRFEAPQLIAFQDLLMNIIINNTKKHSPRHRLISADDAEQWDTAEVSLTEIEMRQAMEQMVDNEMGKIKVQQEFAEELERRMADPSFCLESGASHWSIYEVCHWVSSIGYEYAQRRFFDLEIDGNVLLYDVNRTMLIAQLGIASIHSNKFMRHLNELRDLEHDDNTECVLSYAYSVHSYCVESRSFALNTEWREKLLSLQHEMHAIDCKYLSSQKEMVSLRVDYESIQSSYDLICIELNESKQQMTSLRRMNDELSDENAQLKYNPYLNNENSNDNEDDAYSFLDKISCVDSDPLKWDSQSVAYWLSTIGMKKYLAQFMEQFIDGQILMNDLNFDNLISDLEIKSLHAPKIMREIRKLHNASHQGVHPLQTHDCINAFNIASTQTETNVLIATLKHDLSETRLKLNDYPTQIDEIKDNNLSPQSSIYSAGNACDGNESDAHTVKSNHLRTESSITQKSAYSEGDQQYLYRSATPPLPGNQDELSANWQKYISHLESKNRELSTLFLRADNNLKKYSRAIIPFQERINNLEIQNQTRKKTIDKLNKRIDRRNESIKKLKRQHAIKPMNPLTLSPSTSSISSISSASNAMQLTRQQETYFNNAQKHYIKTHKYANSDVLYKERKERKKAKKSNIILRNNALNNSVSGYMSTASGVDSIQSEPNTIGNNENTSIIGSLYGYIMGAQT